MTRAVGPTCAVTDFLGQSSAASEAGTDGDRRPLIVGIGGTQRAGSTSELCLREALSAAEAAGSRTIIFTAAALDLPMFGSPAASRAIMASGMVEAVRACDGLVVASPSYHGGLSGLVKNALDYLENLRSDRRPYLHGRAVGCITCAAGWQGAVTTLNALRDVVHALRGWPTPLGVPVNTADTPTLDGQFAHEIVRQRLHALGAQVAAFAQAHGSEPDLAPSSP
jgi:FMN reductase